MSDLIQRHPLTDLLADALEMSAAAEGFDPVDGSISVRLSTGHVEVGQVAWVSEDGEAFSLFRIWKKAGRQDYVRADTARWISTAHVVEIHYHEAGA